MAALWFPNVVAERRAPPTAAADKECKGADWTACGRHTLALIWLEWHSATRSGRSTLRTHPPTFSWYGNRRAGQGDVEDFLRRMSKNNVIKNKATAEIPKIYLKT
ncbi:MAG: hypothetical protein ACYCUX_09570 [Metallibacterium sp.]